MELNSKQIHLWFANQAEFEQAELEGKCLGWLSPQERERYDRYHFDHHRTEFLLGRMLIRTVLSEYEAREPASWNFIQNDYGKPAPDPAQTSVPLYFNLSHSGERLVLAISAHEAIGVDIEASSRQRRVERIAQRYFSPAELQALLALPGEQQLSRFYELWTLKEAYIKARGMGLALSLQEFGFDLSDPESLRLWLGEGMEDDSEAWQFWQMQPGDAFQLAVAVKTAGPDRIEEISSFKRSGLSHCAALALPLQRRS